MTYITLDDGVRLLYRLDGPADGPPVLLSNSLGTDLRMWDGQVEALADRFRVVRYDSRGHGQSDAPAGPYTLERLARDALGILDALDIEWADICGLSLGGMVALWIAIHRPSRIRRAVLANTATRIGAAETWAARIHAVKSGGMAAVRDAVLARFLSEGYREREPAVTRLVGAMLDRTPPHGYIGACAALRDADLHYLASTVEARTLVIGGELDQATPPAQAEDLHAAIVPSELMVIPGVAHLSNLEAPEWFNRRLLDHLSAR